MLLRHIATWLQAQWFPLQDEANKASFRTSFWIAVFFMWPIQGLFVLLSGLRRFAYLKGWLPVVRLPVPVIVVGNLTVGGAGKTPLTLWLAEQLIIRGIKPGIISRGYGAGSKHSGSGNLAIPVYPDSDPHVVGDEPVVLARRSLCPVWISARRSDAASALLVAHPETSVILCDDGLQHLAMGRDAEVVVFDSRGPGNGWRLPLGPLRDPLARLKSVDAVVLNGGRASGSWAVDFPQIPVFSMSLQPGTFYQLHEPLVHCSAQDLLQSGKRLHAVAGIGHPPRFFATLKSMGLQCNEHPFPDHHQYGENDLIFAETGILLLTEKDAVKCSALYRGEAWVLPVEAHLPTALEEILLEKIHGYTSA